jgi:kumamolisin
MSKALTPAAYTTIGDSERLPLPGAEATSAANPNQIIEITIKIKRKKELPDITERPAQAISREELASEYGATQEDAQKVINTLTAFGLKATSTDLAACTITFTGTVAEMEKAFLVKLFNYSHPDGGYRGRSGYLHIPKELDGIITGVFGLDNRRVARRKKHVTAHLANQAATTSIPASWYTPAELAKHYSFPTGDGSGQAVGLLEFGGGYFPDDLEHFCQLAGIAEPKVITVSTDGTSTSAKDGAEGEVMMDIEVIAGVCPKSTIVVYFAAFTEKGWITAIDKAIHDKQNNPGVISASWGNPESVYIWSKSAMTAINETLKEAALLGVTVCIAAGDDGSSDADTKDGLAHVDFPSSSPYALAVGGTTIPKKGAQQPDIVWFEGTGMRNEKDPSGSTGGGVSAIFPKPTWQSAITIKSVNPGAITGRVIPDIAANADWVASPYLLVVDGGAQANGGTSAATPLVGALITLINGSLKAPNRTGYLNPVLYQAAAGAAAPGAGATAGAGAAGTGSTAGATAGATIGATCCTDVTSGDNKTAKAGGYSAGTGYDAVSGWGTPIGTELEKAIAKLTQVAAKAEGAAQ